MNRTDYIILVLLVYTYPTLLGYTYIHHERTIISSTVVSDRPAERKRKCI